MAVNPTVLEAAKASPEYQNGLAILGEPDDYATQIMLEFIGFFYLLTIRAEGNIQGLDDFLRELGVMPELNDDNGCRVGAQDEEALVTAFTFIVGRNTREFFEGFLKQRSEFTNN